MKFAIYLAVATLVLVGCGAAVDSVAAKRCADDANEFITYESWMQEVQQAGASANQAQAMWDDGGGEAAKALGWADCLESKGFTCDGVAFVSELPVPKTCRGDSSGGTSFAEIDNPFVPAQ